MHTTHSDGLCSPCEVVIAAAGAGLAALAITDHDTVSALAIARPEAARLGLELVAGAELTCRAERPRGPSAWPFPAATMTRACSPRIGWLRAGRGPRLQAMAESCGTTAWFSTWMRCGNPFPALCWAAVMPPIPGADRSGRQRARGVCKLPGRRRPGLCAQAAAGCLRGHRPDSGRAGASRGWHTRRTICGRRPCGQLAAAGLGAIEVAGPGISNRLGRRFRDWADEFHLVPIAGSDFHAPDRPGRWVGAITTPPADLERLRVGPDQRIHLRTAWPR